MDNDIVHYGHKKDVEEVSYGEYIDLGLESGTKWASCNLGANNPCDGGLLFQFGCVNGYYYGDANHQFTRQDPPPTASGKVYKKGEVLLPEDDAVYVATNGYAHMPTKEQVQELLSNTTKQWCSCSVLGDGHESHNVEGRLLTSKINGNKIFIPACGYYNTSFDYRTYTGLNEEGHLWCASTQDNYEDMGHIINVTSGGCVLSQKSMYYGLSVRGVIETK